MELSDSLYVFLAYSPFPLNLLADNAFLSYSRFANLGVGAIMVLGGIVHFFGLKLYVF